MSTNPDNDYEPLPPPAGLGLQLQALRAALAGRSVAVFDPKAEYVGLTQAGRPTVDGGADPAGIAGT